MASIEYYQSLGFPYAVAYEKNANDRAQVDLYESAAHKEMYANERAKAEGIWKDDPVTGQSAVSAKEADANARAALDIDPRTGAKFVSAAAKEDYANEQSRKVFNPVTGANFTSAVDYEIDANRRAREAGWLNAADLELYGPEGATRSDAPFVDPRDVVWEGPPERYHIDTANLLKYNPDQPGHPDYDPDWRNKYDAATDTYILNKPTGGGTTTGGGAGSMDLTAFRPWTQTYWNQFMPKGKDGISSNSLLYMQKPQQEYSLSYLPGEFRDPKVWQQWEEGPIGHSGHIPTGAWWNNPKTYPDAAAKRLGSHGAQRFTAEGLPVTGTTPLGGQWGNIARNPWTASQMNLTPAQGAKWKGLLTGLDTAPAVDTSIASLLGVT